MFWLNNPLEKCQPCYFLEDFIMLQKKDIFVLGKYGQDFQFPSSGMRVMIFQWWLDLPSTKTIPYIVDWLLNHT